jgi:hypothetical protein
MVGEIHVNVTPEAATANSIGQRRRQDHLALVDDSRHIARNRPGAHVKGREVGKCGSRDAPPMPRLHPNLAELYRQKVMNLAQALNEEHMRLEAAECIRKLIEEIRLVPDNGKLRVELYGELAALVNLANEHPRSKGTGVQITLVAGACNHRELTWPPIQI